METEDWKLGLSHEIVALLERVPVVGFDNGQMIHRRCDLIEIAKELQRERNPHDPGA